MSGGGSLFKATEPEGCDCDKVTIASVKETLSATNRKIESNRGCGLATSWYWKQSEWGSIFGDQPQEMSPL